MNSSGGNSHKRQNDFDKRGEYQNVDQISSQIRESLIKPCTEKVIDHAAGNGGCCCQGFVKELVNKIFQRAPLLEITRNNINNNVRIIKGQCEEEEQQTVSPATPFHIIRNLFLLTNSELSVCASSSSNEQNTLYIQKVKQFERFKIQIKLKFSMKCN